jgi:UDP-GlcNAc:undecaprenyl-phosphate GlcNAc-1-phosphate transferase
MDFFYLMLFPILACVAVLLLVPPARKFALRIGYVDKPGGRKNHENPTPPIGGLVIVPVFIAVSLISGANVMVQWPFWLGLFAIMLVGVLDDRYAIAPRWKFVAQFFAAILIVCVGEANVEWLGNLLGFGTIYLGFMAKPFSIIATVLLINAINLIDGLDGLAGGKSLVAMFWMLVVCFIFDAGGAGLSLAIFMGALAGFLVFNMRHPFRERANIFLGDAGSMSLGLALAWYGMRLGHAGVIAPITVAWILALPIMDTCAQFARRVSQGRHPFDADRNHFHHHFINAGVEVSRATAIITLIGFILGAIGVIGMVLHVPEPVLGWLWIVTILTHMYLSMRPHRFRRIVAAFMKTPPQ